MSGRTSEAHRPKTAQAARPRTMPAVPRNDSFIGDLSKVERILFGLDLREKS